MLFCLATVRGAQIEFSHGEAVLVDQSTEAGTALDVLGARRAHRLEPPVVRDRRCPVERPVRPMAVVVVDEDAEHGLEMSSAE